MKKLYLFTLAIFAVLFISGINCKDAKAGSVKEIGTYSNKYDITNDGKADVIKIKGKSSYGYIYDYKIYVNGNKVYTGKSDFGSYELSASYAYVNKKESYLNVYGSSDNNCCAFSILLKYVDGKLKEVNDFKFGTYDTKVVKINKKKMIVESTTQPTATGYIDYEIKFVKRAGKWKQSSKTYEVVGGWFGDSKERYTTKKAIKLYKASTCTGASFKVKKGKKVQLLKVKPYEDEWGTCLRGQFKYGKKKGWMDLDDFANYEVFKGVMLAG